MSRQVFPSVTQDMDRYRSSHISVVRKTKESTKTIIKFEQNAGIQPPTFTQPPANVTLRYRRYKSKYCPPNHGKRLNGVLSDKVQDKIIFKYCGNNTQNIRGKKTSKHSLSSPFGLVEVLQLCHECIVLFLVGQRVYTQMLGHFLKMRGLKHGVPGSITPCNEAQSYVPVKRREF